MPEAPFVSTYLLKVTVTLPDDGEGSADEAAKGLQSSLRTLVKQEFSPLDVSVTEPQLVSRIAREDS